jgi:hypothetical protein
MRQCPATQCTHVLPFSVTCTQCCSRWTRGTGVQRLSEARSLLAKCTAHARAVHSNACAASTATALAYLTHRPRHAHTRVRTARAAERCTHSKACALAHEHTPLTAHTYMHVLRHQHPVRTLGCSWAKMAGIKSARRSSSAMIALPRATRRSIVCPHCNGARSGRQEGGEWSTRRG